MLSAPGDIIGTVTQSEQFEAREGRSVFGAVAETYDAARPAYPERVFDILASRCGLRPGARVIDIGAGSGQVTRRLLGEGAVVVAVEPSEALAAEMTRQLASSRLEVILSPFEDVAVESASFDLAVSATAFHWLDVHRSLGMIREALRPDGWIALWWNVFGDPDVPDPFHVATQPLLSPATLGPGTDTTTPFALDVTARQLELEQHGFVDIALEVIRWDLVLTAEQTRRLYATYSNILRLAEQDRRRMLDGIERIAREEFDDRVVRKMLTPIYTGRRR